MPGRRFIQSSISLYPNFQRIVLYLFMHRRHPFASRDVWLPKSAEQMPLRQQQGSGPRTGGRRAGPRRPRPRFSGRPNGQPTRGPNSAFHLGAWLEPPTGAVLAEGRGRAPRAPPPPLERAVPAAAGRGETCLPATLREVKRVPLASATREG